VTTLSARGTRKHAGHQHIAFKLFGIQPEPWPYVAAAAPRFHQIGQYILEQIDRHKHIAGKDHAGVQRVTDPQRSDADQPALAVEQRRTAVFITRRRGEQRIVDHVFPPAGETPP